MRELLPVARSNLRRRWRSTVVLAVLVGVAFGVTTGAAIGARRTATAFPRFVDQQAAPDLVMVAGQEGDVGTDAIRTLPQVHRAGVGTGVGVLLRNPDGSPDFERDAFGAVVSDGVFGYEVDRPLLLDGRLPDPREADELVLDENAVRTTGAEVGDVIAALTFNVREIEQVSAEFEASGREPTQADFDRVFTPVDFVVVGIGRTSGSVLTNESVAGEPSALLSPAFLDEHPDTASYTVAAVDLLDPSTAGAYITALRAALPGTGIGPIDQAGLRESFAATVRPYWLALAFFALVFGAGAALSVGPALVRAVDDDLADRVPLRALGVTARQLVGVAVVRVGVVLGGGLLLGVALAVAGSDRFPVGPARAAEPDPGSEVHLAGLAIAAALLLVTALAAAVRRSLASIRRPAGRVVRPSRLATRAGALGLSPAALTGVHAAIGGGDRDRGRAGAVPLGLAVALAVAIGALGFGSGLSRLVSDPARFGWNWDVLFENYDFALDDDAVREIGDDPAVADVVPISRGSVTLDGRPVPAVGMELGAGTAVAPVAIDGRPPTAPGEVALGVVTARELGVDVGDTVTGDATDGRARPLEVVGISVIPSLAVDSSHQLGHGAVVVRDDYEAMAGWYPTAALATLRAGATLEELEDRFAGGVSPLGVQRPADVMAYDGIDEVPHLLAAVLGGLAVAVLLHLLAGSVRRRRRELAVLRTLGLRPQEVAWSVLWQSNVLIAAVLVLAVPAGLAAGRSSWRWFASAIGVADDPSAPLVAVATAAVAVIVLANLLAAVPARRASSVHPARTLRVE